MKLRWTADAVADLGRVRDFLHSANPTAGAKVLRTLRTAAVMLTDHPRIGRPIRRYEPRQVRRMIVGQYEVYYEIDRDLILVLSVMHSREDRPLP